MVKKTKENLDESLLKIQSTLVLTLYYHKQPVPKDTVTSVLEAGGNGYKLMSALENASVPARCGEVPGTGILYCTPTRTRRMTLTGDIRTV
jgi:hypothetical protein